MGGATVGAAVGTFAGPVGNIIGGIAGGVVGCAVATEVYETAVKLGVEGAQAFVDKAEEFANTTVDLVSKNIPDKIEDVKTAFSDFAKDCNLPFSI